MLNKSKGKFVALSNVHDYIYRPSAFASVNLYNWIRCANKKRKPSKRRKNDKPEIQDEMAEQANDYDNDTDPEDELDIIGDKFIGGGNYVDAAEQGSETDWVDSDQDNSKDELNINENVQYKEDDTKFYSFLPEHPQYDTHEIQCKYLSERSEERRVGKE